ncbi:MAG TPA: TIGR03617 family F420-dependent LLM class oxidoreductase [Anaerolineales bacterium]|nr:TIGR03617 family F420-dependent LLM class oxidoreductase [Anaerolineales bacterium]
MKFDAALPPTSLTQVPALARAAEALGFDGLWSTETQHAPFLPGPLVFEHTKRIEFGTAIAIAFARSPTTLAYTAWDLAQASQGRFILGLGTQVKAHIERRFGMPWPDSVVQKFREQIQAIRALWRAWQTGEKLNFRGEYHSLTLMTPFFNPGPIEFPQIPIYIAGVNTGLARLAGETADGFHIHPFHTPKYLAEVLLPAIESGAAKAERSRAEVQLSGSAFVVFSPETEAFVRQQISFYASTPSYLAVMELHGWSDTAKQLSALAARGQWNAMPELITDEMLETFAVRAQPQDLRQALLTRYQNLLDRLSLYLPFVPGQADSLWAALLGKEAPKT